MTINVLESLTKGVKLHQAGQFVVARKLYASILEVEPKHPDANHNAGAIELISGKTVDAVSLLRTALEENPNNNSIG